jgi:hypothetical protein
LIFSKSVSLVFSMLKGHGFGFAALFFAPPASVEDVQPVVLSGSVSEPESVPRFAIQVPLSKAMNMR